jgi:hypothetical protein
MKVVYCRKMVNRESSMVPRGRMTTSATHGTYIGITLLHKSFLRLSLDKQIVFSIYTTVKFMMNCWSISRLDQVADEVAERWVAGQQLGNNFVQSTAVAWPSLYILMSCEHGASRHNQTIMFSREELIIIIRTL